MREEKGKADVYQNYFLCMSKWRGDYTSIIFELCPPPPSPPPIQKFSPSNEPSPPLNFKHNGQPIPRYVPLCIKKSRTPFPTLISVIIIVKSKSQTDYYIFFFFFSLEEARQIGKGLLAPPPASLPGKKRAGLRDRVPGVPPYIRIPMLQVPSYVLNSVILTFGKMTFGTIWGGEGEGSRN